MALGHLGRKIRRAQKKERRQQGEKAAPGVEAGVMRIRLTLIDGLGELLLIVVDVLASCEVEVLFDPAYGEAESGLSLAFGGGEELTNQPGE